MLSNEKGVKISTCGSAHDSSGYRLCVLSSILITFGLSDLYHFLLGCECNDIRSQDDALTSSAYPYPHDIFLHIRGKQIFDPPFSYHAQFVIIALLLAIALLTMITIVYHDSPASYRVITSQSCPSLSKCLSTHA